jgi:hypothetical protein
MVDALAEHVDDAPFADFARKAGEKLVAIDVLCVVAVTHAKLGKGIGLCGKEEGKQVMGVDGVLAIVVVRTTSCIAGTPICGRGLWRHDVRARLSHHCLSCAV